MKLAELVIVADGQAACLRLTSDAKKEWDALHQGTDNRSTKRITQLDRYVQSFCDTFDHRAPDTHFKKEGTYPDGKAGKAAVFAFKPFQWRLYGVVCTVEGKKCFVGTKVDPEKKQDKADPDILKSAAVRMGDFEDYGQNEKKEAAGNGKKGRGRKRG